MKQQIIDLGVRGTTSWHGVLDLLHRLCAGAADLSYGDRVIANRRLPSLEARLDDPARLMPPDIRENMHIWPDCKVLLGGSVPQTLAGDIYLMPQSGASASVYQAFLALVNLLALLGGLLDRVSFQWAWYSIPIAPFCDDLAETQARWRAASEMGAVLSLWTRCDKDEAMREALAALPPSGEVRLHNLKTANTVIAGSIREDAVAGAFGLRQPGAE